MEGAEMRVEPLNYRLFLLYTLCSSAPSRCEKLLIASFRMKQAAFINKLTPLNERENNGGCRAATIRSLLSVLNVIMSTCMLHIAP